MQHTEQHEEDDVISQEPPSQITQGKGRRRQGVAAESFDPSAADDVTSGAAKTEAQRARLNSAVRGILLFRSLDEEQLGDVIDAMFERRVEPGERVITQGEDGDNFYVIESGQFEIRVHDTTPTVAESNDATTAGHADDATAEKVVGEYAGQGSFGELALMYNTPRAASIVAVTQGVLWAMTRAEFRRVVLGRAAQRRTLYEALVEGVPLLRELSAYERTRLADALRTRIAQPGQRIIQQGEPGTEMFFVEEGRVRVLVAQQTADEQKQLDGEKEVEKKEAGKEPEIAQQPQEKEVAVLGEGAYFGELALLTKQPRAASVQAVERTKLAVLDVESFERLLGPCVTILQRNIARYEDQLRNVFGHGDLSRLPELRK